MIDYYNIHSSINFFEDKGYKRIESPWTVTPSISAITKPKDCIDYEIKHNKKVLVASGEQSFLYLYLKGFLPKGRFQTVTPCFRDEIFDEIHTKYFIKNELIITDKVDQHNLYVLINQCKEFFESILLTEVQKTQTDFGFDLYYKNIELGSYGIRECNYLKWIYGTACAEPRLSYCKNLSK